MAEEYQHLTNSFKKNRRKGYGAAMPNSGTEHQVNVVSVLHKVVKSDSLTSLAIRYGSTVADIKRANKLWSTEALSFRDTINIPVNSDQSSDVAESSQHSELVQPSDISLTLSSSGAINSTNTSFDGFADDFAKCVSLVPDQPKAGHSSAGQSTDLSIEPVLGPELTINGETASSGDDFFAKFDQSLSALKKKVEHQAATSSSKYAGGDDVLYDSKPVLRTKPSQNGRGKSVSSQRSSHSSIRSSTDDIRSTPEPVIKSKVKKKLKKHEQRQDELFSL